MHLINKDLLRKYFLGSFDEILNFFSMNHLHSEAKSFWVHPWFELINLCYIDRDLWTIPQKISIRRTFYWIDCLLLFWICLIKVPSNSQAICTIIIDESKSSIASKSSTFFSKSSTTFLSRQSKSSSPPSSLTRSTFRIDHAFTSRN